MISMSQQHNPQQKAGLMLFVRKLGLMFKPAKTTRVSLAANDSVRLDSVVVVDMSHEQPLVEAFRQVKLMSHRGKKQIRVLINQVHSDAQATSVFNKLSALCESFLDTELVFIGGVPSESVLNKQQTMDVRFSRPAKNFLMKHVHAAAGNSDKPESDDLMHHYRLRSNSNLSFIQDYWDHTRPLNAAVGEK